VKLLVLAQTPPPLHGQSKMVQAAIDGLRQIPGCQIHHVALRLSTDHADIGRWRAAKVGRTLTAAVRAIWTQLRHRCAALYYVPAPPAKRGALYRDWLVLALCRPFFPRLILHWHAAGLASWLMTSAHPLERFLSRLLLGRATLALVLAEGLRDEAVFFRARRTVVLPNGVPDPAPPPRATPGSPRQILFLGLCSEAKGVFSAAAAVLQANELAGETRYHFVAAGAFPDDATAARFSDLAQAHPGIIRHAGFVDGTAKAELFAQSHALLFPTRYAAEAMPLVVLEALAHDVPVIATRWRALPEIISPECGCLADSFVVPDLAAALLRLDQSPPAVGACRRHYLSRYSLDRHITHLAEALRQATV
jgi:glycosyltransferase involved in cell wall biosynthesis